MKKSLTQLSLVISLCFLLCFSVSCQQGKVTLDESQKAEITETIKQLTKEIFEAGSNNELDRMFSYFSDNTITIEHGTIDYSWEEHKKIAHEMMANMVELKYTMGEIEVDVLSADVAVLYGFYSYMMKDKSDNTFEGKDAWTWVFNYEEDEWKIRHVHISALFAKLNKRRNNE